MCHRTGITWDGTPIRFMWFVMWQMTHGVTHVRHQMGYDICKMSCFSGQNNRPEAWTPTSTANTQRHVRRVSVSVPSTGLNRTYSIVSLQQSPQFDLCMTFYSFCQWALNSHPDQTWTSYSVTHAYSAHKLKMVVYISFVNFVMLAEMLT